MKSPNTQPSLIVQLQGVRNERAWEEFVCAYEPFLRRLIARQGVPQRYVPDVTQQVFAAIARSVQGWSDDGQPESFRRWLQRVARNVVLRFMCRERREPGAFFGTGGTDLIHLLQGVSDAEPLDDQSYEFELILWAAAEVRNEFRQTSWEAFWRTLIEGESVEEVARDLRISPGSIYMSRSRIMSRIREKIHRVYDQ